MARNLKQYILSEPGLKWCMCEKKGPHFFNDPKLEAFSRLIQGKNVNFPVQKKVYNTILGNWQVNGME